jgi:hypothetical protein
MSSLPEVRGRGGCCYVYAMNGFPQTLALCLLQLNFFRFSPEVWRRLSGLIEVCVGGHEKRSDSGHPPIHCRAVEAQGCPPPDDIIVVLFRSLLIPSFHLTEEITLPVSGITATSAMANAGNEQKTGLPALAASRVDASLLPTLA